MSNTLAILDQQKAIQLAAGNKQLADDLLTMLIKELPTYKKVIQKELQNGNKEELRKTIHKIHGGLRYVGAPALLDIISKTDHDFFTLSDAQLSNNMTKIDQEIDRLLDEETYGKI